MQRAHALEHLDGSSRVSGPSVRLGQGQQDIGIGVVAAGGVLEEHRGLAPFARVAQRLDQCEQGARLFGLAAPGLLQHGAALLLLAVAQQVAALRRPGLDALPAPLPASVSPGGNRAATGLYGCHDADEEGPSGKGEDDEHRQRRRDGARRAEVERDRSRVEPRQVGDAAHSDETGDNDEGSFHGLARSARRA